MKIEKKIQEAVEKMIKLISSWNGKSLNIRYKSGRTTNTD